MGDTNSSFYADGGVYDTGTVTSNDVPGSTTPSAAPSSMYPDGTVYDTLVDSDTVLATMTALAAATSADKLAADTDAATATTQAGIATTQAGIAAADAAAAASSETNAAASAAAASTSETNAAASAASASTSETNAASSAAAASGSASAAAGSASAASTSASNAATSETGAAASASAASGSASSAAASASAASTSETNAAASASAASTSDSNAASSATAAAGSASTASTEASNAAASASAASTSETNAASSATAAAGSDTSAAAYATATAGLLTSFQGVYYGAFAADPTLDPNGSAPNSGDLYWNTASSILKIYDGAAWQGYTPSGLPVNNPIFTGSISGPLYQVSGGGAAYYMDDRTTGSADGWWLYGDGGQARLYSNLAGTDLFALDSTGLSLPQTTASTSTTTGAFRVGGGIGIAGSAHFGGNVTAADTGYNPATSAWAANAAVNVSGSYGGAINWIDSATAGFSTRTQAVGTEWYLAQGAVTGGLTDLVKVSSSGLQLFNNNLSTSGLRFGTGTFANFTMHSGYTQMWADDGSTQFWCGNTSDPTIYLLGTFIDVFDSSFTHHSFSVVPSTGVVEFPAIGTTASAANAFVDGSSNNSIKRSTSSLRYKTDVEQVSAEYRDASLAIQPIWYRSKASGDNPAWSFYGMAAEEVAAIDPRLCHWAYLDDDYEIVETPVGDNKTRKDRRVKAGAKMVPDAVMYDRVAILQIASLKAKNDALEARIAALEAARSPTP